MKHTMSESIYTSSNRGGIRKKRSISQGRYISIGARIFRRGWRNGPGSRCDGYH